MVRGARSTESKLMKTYIKQMSVLFLAALASLFLLDAYAGKPVKVTVTAADPPSAVQGDITDVYIDGTGFDTGSTARFIVTGTRDDTQITVLEPPVFDHATGKLKAKIKVKDAALPVEYDIEVKTSSGRRGKGTTLFRVEHKEGQEDPCVDPETFAPDFAFFRDTGTKKKAPKVTIVLAESFTGCEMSLLEFPIISPLTELRNLKFSSVEDDSGYFGRVVWTSNRSSAALSVWKQDFYTDGADVILLGGLIEILRNTLDDDPLEIENIYSLDLSPDTRTLVYRYTHNYPDPDDLDTNLGRRAVRILDIEPCDQSIADPCGFGDLDNVLELDWLFAGPSDVSSFQYPSWGSLGERVYVRRTFDLDIDGIDRERAIKYYDFMENWQNLEWPPTITNVGITPDIGYFSRVASGIVGGEEYLAIEREFSVKTGGCKGIFIVNAEDCLVNGNCTTEPEFAGALPSWSKDGILIHAYDGWVPHGGCDLRSVGYWDSSGSLESLFDGGYWPDAAGGIR